MHGVTDGLDSGGSFQRNEKSPKLDKSFINTYFFYLQLDHGIFVGCHVVLLFPSKLKEREEEMERMREHVFRQTPDLSPRLQNQ